MPKISSPVMRARPAFHSHWGIEARTAPGGIRHPSIPQGERYRISCLFSLQENFHRSLALLPRGCETGFRANRLARHESEIDLAIFETRAQHLHAYRIA